MRKKIGQLIKTSIEDNSKNPTKFGYDTKKELWLTTDNPELVLRKRLLAVGNSGKITEPRKEVRGRDIWNNDIKRVERDEEKYRKKKSKKSKTKRKTKKDCGCK